MIDLVKGYKPKRNNKLISRDELDKLLNCWDVFDPYRLVAEFQAFVGLRSCEAVAVNLWDFGHDFKRLRVRLAKRKDNKVIEKVVPDVFAEKIKSYCRLNQHRLLNGYLFVPFGHGSRNKHIKKQSYWEEFSRARKQARLLDIECYDKRGKPMYRVGTHSLRRFYCCNLADSGLLNIEEIRRIMGHTKIDTSLLYIYETTQLKSKEVLAVNKG